MKPNGKVAFLLTIVVVGSTLVGSAALATPATGPKTIPSVPVVGVLDGRARAAQDGIALFVRDDTTVKTFELTYPYGAASGWHKHPGIVIAVVKSGTVHRITAPGCKAETFTTGNAFTEVGAHYVWNEGPGDATLVITQLLPKGIDPSNPAQTRIDVGEQCKHPYHR
jgi:hypothetical protein